MSQMLGELNAALDRAEADEAAVVLTGRSGVFSAGFDLAVLRADGPAAAAMVRSGFELAARLLAFPAPVLAACTGHAVAMGSSPLTRSSPDWPPGDDPNRILDLAEWPQPHGLWLMASGWSMIRAARQDGGVGVSGTCRFPGPV